MPNLEIAAGSQLDRSWIAVDRFALCMNQNNYIYKTTRAKYIASAPKRSIAGKAQAALVSDTQEPEVNEGRGNESRENTMERHWPKTGSQHRLKCLHESIIVCVRDFQILDSE
jgi:hypothetical protein